MCVYEEPNMGPGFHTLFHALSSPRQLPLHKAMISHHLMLVPISLLNECFSFFSPFKLSSLFSQVTGRCWELKSHETLVDLIGETTPTNRIK